MAGIKAVPASTPDPKIGTARRVSGVVFPYVNLSHSIAVAKAMHEKAGGECDRAQLAALLGYKGVKNGAFLSRVAAAKTFGLIDQEGDRLRITQRGRSIISPITGIDAERAKVDAFLQVELFKKVYEEYKGTSIPSEIGLRNLLDNKYHVVKDRIAPTVRIMLESAEEAGFFKAAGPTSMVMPILSPEARAAAPSPMEHHTRHEPPKIKRGGGHDGGDGGDYDPGNIHPAIMGLLKELPPAGSAMSAKKRSALIAAFTATVGFIYPELEEA